MKKQLDVNSTHIHEVLLIELNYNLGSFIDQRMTASNKIWF